MKFARPDAEVFIPDGAAEDAAFRRATYAGVGAHQDDLEIMALHGILAGFGSDNDRFLGVTVTDGAGSARSGPYASTTDADMMLIRRAEQRKAAVIGEYSAMVQLNHPSAAAKNPRDAGLAADLAAVLGRLRPKVLYTHNLADKHDTHVALAMHVIRAVRTLPREARPARVLGCEVWRNLDWMLDEDKTVLDISARANLAGALIGVFDSQVAGGKRYDLATLGRWRANATYFASHATDTATSLLFAMDLTPLVTDDALDPAAHVRRYVERFAADVAARIGKYA